jgi:hypothetical protein
MNFDVSKLKKNAKAYLEAEQEVWAGVRDRTAFASDQEELDRLADRVLGVAKKRLLDGHSLEAIEAMMIDQAVQTDRLGPSGTIVDWHPGYVDFHREMIRQVIAHLSQVQLRVASIAADVEAEEAARIERAKADQRQGLLRRALGA